MVDNPNYGNFRYIISPKFETITEINKICGDDEFREILDEEEKRVYEDLHRTCTITNK
jgi:hypothetical protein